MQFAENVIMFEALVYVLLNEFSCAVTNCVLIWEGQVLLNFALLQQIHTKSEGRRDGHAMGAHHGQQVGCHGVVFFFFNFMGLR